MKETKVLVIHESLQYLLEGQECGKQVIQGISGVSLGQFLMQILDEPVRGRTLLDMLLMKKE